MAVEDLIKTGFTRRQANRMQELNVDTVARIDAAAAVSSVVTTQASVDALQVIVAQVIPEFRGAWSALTVKLSYDFTDSLVPAEFTNNGGAPTVVVNPGGSGTPPPLGKCLTFDCVGYRSVSLTIPAGITQLKDYTQEISQWDSDYAKGGIKVNGSVVVGPERFAWRQDTLTVVPGNVVEWFLSTDSFHGYFWLGLVELLGATEPYMTGDAVTYGGALYTSAADNNGSIPGTDANWTRLIDSSDALSTAITTLTDRLDAMSVGGPSFRSNWASLSVITDYDFVSGFPSDMVNAAGASVGANPGGAGAPPRGSVLNWGGGGSNVQLTIPAGVTQIKFYSTCSGGGDNAGFGFKVNGTDRIGLDGPRGWRQDTVTVVPGDAVQWYTHSSYSAGTSASIGLVELLGASDPYMIGDAVVHAGILYSSAVDNNGSTPGADGNWTSLLIGTTP